MAVISSTLDRLRAECGNAYDYTGKLVTNVMVYDLLQDMHTRKLSMPFFNGIQEAIGPAGEETSQLILRWPAGR